MLTSETSEQGNGWYLPHFPAMNPDKATTKARVVFDVSAKFKGVSLSDNITQGTKMQNHLLDVLLRFRMKSVAIICDVTEMYLQLQLATENRPYHRHLWRGVC